MKKDIFTEILLFFDSKDVSYKLHKHKPVITSREAEEVKLTDALGVKSLLFKTEKSKILLVLPGSKKVSSKKVRALLKVKDVRMVSAEEVLSTMGCEVGGCYPLGFICGVNMMVDGSVQESDRIIFNIGRRDMSVEMSWEDFERTVPFEIADLTQSLSG